MVIGAKDKDGKPAPCDRGKGDQYNGNKAYGGGVLVNHGGRGCSYK